MKHLFLFVFLMGILVNTIAQNNVGIGTQSPHASAALDVSSTTRGLLAPRMTSAQRTAIAAPAKGLLVYDTDVNSLFHYNGLSWANLAAGGGGGFSLPFAAAVNLNAPTFQIENAGSGDVLFLGASSGSAINAYNTGNSAAINVSGVNGFGVYAQSFNSIPIFALSNNANNTLPAIRANNTGGGVGLHGTSAKNDGILGITTTANKAGIRGEAASSGGIGVYGISQSSTGAGVSGFNNTTGTGVLGTSIAGNGVEGITSGTTFAGVYGEYNGSSQVGYGVRGRANDAQAIGVAGSSVNGIGVSGFSQSNIAVRATSPGGTALWGTTTTGYALETSGKVKIAGGNTNPSAGAVLTSIDADGNAVWKPNRVAFRAAGVHSISQSIPHKTYTKLHFAIESYDFGNNFLPTTSASPTATMSSFTVPVNGVYHFDMGCFVQLGGFADDFIDVKMRIMVNRAGNIFTITTSESSCCKELGGYYHIYRSNDVQLLSGDIVYVEIYHNNDGNENATITNNQMDNFFNGHLVIAD